MVKKGFFPIPIYGAGLDIVVVDKNEDASKVSLEIFGADRIEGNDPTKHGVCAGLTSFDHDGNFQVLFVKDYLNHGVIAHEIFHLSEVIHDFINAKGEFTGEHAANLTGYLTDLVYGFLRKHKIKVKYAEED